MTDQEIERRVQRMIDHLDHLLAMRQLSQDDYDKALRDLAQWEEAKRNERMAKECG